MNNKTAKELLTDFGLTKKEAEVYLFLAKYEILTGGEIAKQKKIARSLVYRILKSLQNKGLVESTLETPTRFIAISLEKAINLIIKTKQDEALQVQKLKKPLLKDWKNVTKSKPKLNYERFVVIEDRKKIYSKILQMILSTEEKFLGLLTTSTLAIADQFGVLEALHNRLLNFGISYQLLTNIKPEDFEDFKKINRRLVPGIKLNLKTSIVNSKEFPRVFIRDDEEILFFIRPESEFLSDEQNEVCIFTNCASLLQTFKSIFDNTLNCSITATKAVQKYDSGNIQEQNLDSNETDFMESASSKSRESPLMKNEEVEIFTGSGLETKIQQLSEDEEEILEFASVAGDEFSLKLIEKLANYSRLKLLKKLDALERKHQLILSTESGYRFIAREIREFIYYKLSPKLKKEYHKLFLEYYQKDGFSEEVMGNLGYHLSELGKNTEAIITYLNAGIHAKSNWKIFEAIEYYSKALQLMGNKKRWKKERSEVFESLGFLYSLSDDFEKANKFFRNGLKIADDKNQAEKIQKKIYEKVTLTKKETNFSYFVYGTGKNTIIFIGASYHFIPQIFHFSKEYQIVYIDLLRITESKKHPSEYTVNSYLDFLHGIIENLENSTIHLVGVGLGGALALSYIFKHPQKIAKLVLLAVQIKKLSSEDEQYRKKIDNFWINAFQNPSWGWKEMKERITPNYFKWQKKAVPRSQDLFKIWNEIPEITSIIMMKLLMEIELEPLLEKIKIPTLILHGENDPISISNVKKMNEKISNSNLHIFEGVRLPTIFAAEKFNTQIEKFLLT